MEYDAIDNEIKLVEKEEELNGTLFVKYETPERKIKCSPITKKVSRKRK